MEARDAVRRLVEAAGAPVGGVEVVLHGGDYEVGATIEFERRDSGVAGSPIVYRAAEGERARLVGGVVLRDVVLEPVADGGVGGRLAVGVREHVCAVDLRGLLGEEGVARLVGPVHRGMGVADRAIGSEVFLDDRALTLARWPNADEAGGFARVASIVDAGSIPRNREGDVAPEQRETGPDRGGTFRFEDARLERWAGAEDAWAFGYWHWDWADELLPVARVHAEAGTVTLGMPHRYGLRAGAAFYVTNLLEELDAPGEYYIDRERGVLYVWPPAGRSVERLVVSTLGTPLVRLDGARHLEFIGLGFECTRGSAIEGVGVEHVRIAGCSVRNTGSGGVSIRGIGSQVRSCDLADIGGTGITVSGGDRATLEGAGNSVVNNHVERFGRVWRTYHPAIAVGGVGQRIASNRLHDGPHSAIVFSGNDHVIELNEISDVLKETGDSGAIYCGRDWTLHGTVIRHNLFHHIRGTSDRWQNAVYLDDMASGITVTGNVFYECNWGMLIGGGRDLLIEGNLFIGGRQGVRFDARGVGWMASHIADPSRSTLHRNLEAVPYREPPWSERFPRLRGYLTEGFGRPMGSAVVGNVAVGVPLGSVDDREAVRVEGNVERVLEPGAVVEGTAGRGVRFGAETLGFADVEGFEAIPVGRIGLFADEWRRGR